MKIALMHDWLTGMRGGEKVLAELASMFPSADIFTLLWNHGSVAPSLEARVRSVSFLQRLPFAESAYRNYLPLFPFAVRSLDLSRYDAVISSSHAFAKSVRVPSHAVHISYVHTPMRYLWDQRDDYFQFGRGRHWKRVALRAISPGLRRFDRATTAGVHYMVANSANVRERIRKIYGCDACVIHPPVDTDFFKPSASQSPGGYYLVASSLEPYKRIDLAVDAFAGGDRRLVVAGRGTLAAQIRKRARPPVEFVGEVSGEQLRQLYQGCRALIFPGREDFGMVPVEAQACGRPVVCFAQGGAAETVIDGQTGIHFHEQTTETIIAAVDRLEGSTWDPSSIRANSVRFSRQKFRQRFSELWREIFPSGAGLEEGAEAALAADSAR